MFLRQSHGGRFGSQSYEIPSFVVPFWSFCFRNVFHVGTVFKIYIIEERHFKQNRTTLIACRLVEFYSVLEKITRKPKFGQYVTGITKTIPTIAGRKHSKFIKKDCSQNIAVQRTIPYLSSVVFVVSKGKSILSTVFLYLNETWQICLNGYCFKRGYWLSQSTSWGTMTSHKPNAVFSC